MSRGRPPSQVLQGSDTNPSCGPTGVVATAWRYKEIGRNTGDLPQWVRDPTGRPRGTGRAGGGVGQARSTVETGECRRREGASGQRATTEAATAGRVA